jgi:hypothetical protein
MTPTFENQSMMFYFPRENRFLSAKEPKQPNFFTETETSGETFSPNRL